jgi:hypothetical protein
VTASKDPWVLSVMAHHDNPYDGATLKECIHKAENFQKRKLSKPLLIRAIEAKSIILNKLLKGRSGIEPIIGHLKHDHLLKSFYS